jgi:hypothetical protein
MTVHDNPALFVRVGDRILPAPAEDQEVARRYFAFEDKGPVGDGARVTILTRHLEVKPGAEVRIIHVFEALTAARTLYLMGPKPVLGEYVDGLPAAPIARAGEDSLVPEFYDGRTLSGPGIDYNYEITQYRFDVPGMHQIQWCPGPLQSNTLVIRVMTR